MEQRAEERVDISLRFFVQVHESEEDPDMVGLSLECEAIDFSAHGMQFSTNSELSIGALVNVTVGVADPFAMYMLRDQARWVRNKDDVYFMGVLINQDEDTDIVRWLDNFEERFSPAA